MNSMNIINFKSIAAIRIKFFHDGFEKKTESEFDKTKNQNNFWSMLRVSKLACLSYKSCNNLSVVTKFGYIFAVTNIKLYTKNCV